MLQCSFKKKKHKLLLCKELKDEQCILSQGLVDYYEKNELADSFPDVATTLRIPYKSVASK